ncbi:MAG: o-succinylbenzoate synthase [Acidobacteria bacterium]|nr:MAG: o-succinylbenzoate synthase [Acidobacteriota bacterium]
MRIKRVEIREIRLPLVHFFETSFGRTTMRRIVLVRAEAGDIEGWGEVTCGEAPFYNYETPETAWHILRDFLIPWALEREWESPSALAEGFRPIRGHNMAKAAIENACWDIEARRQGLPLARLVGGTLEEIPCGVSIGIQDSPEALLEKIARETAAGYQRIKVKIKPGWDTQILERVREKFPHVPLMADANSAYSLRDVERLKEFDRFNLMMVEQPLGWEDLVDHAKLQRELATPICLDESIHSVEDARKAIEIGACKIINVKLGRVGGFTAARELHDFCLAKRFPLWCGGMLESGVGRAANIAMSALPGFVLPGDVSASRRYWREDIVDPEVTVTAEGTIRVPTSPGLGFTPNLGRIEKATVRKESF